MKNRCLFLDRDGVINYDFGYVYLEKDFKFREEIFSLCKEAKNNFFKIIVITNQSGIGRGYYSENEFQKLNKYMLNIFKLNDINIDDVYFCPFHPIYGKGKYLKNSYYRKPNPGMFLKAAKMHNIDLMQSIMIGDKKSDNEAAFKAGIGFYVDANLSDWIDRSLEFIKKNNKR